MERAHSLVDDNPNATYQRSAQKSCLAISGLDFSQCFPPFPGAACLGQVFPPVVRRYSSNVDDVSVLFSKPPCHRLSLRALSCRSDSISSAGNVACNAFGLCPRTHTLARLEVAFAPTAGSKLEARGLGRSNLAINRSA